MPGSNVQVLGYFLATALVCRPANSQNPQYPGPAPGPMAITMQGDSLTASNAALAVTWTLGSGGLKLETIRDGSQNRVLQYTGEVFRIVFTNGRSVSASSLTMPGKPVLGDSGARQGDGRSAAGRGKEVSLLLRSDDGRVNVRWRVAALDQANYIRQFLDVLPETTDVMREIQWFEQVVPGACTAGTVDGSPVVAGSLFMACEDPHALNAAEAEQHALGTWTGSDLAYGQTRRKTWPVNPTLLVAGSNRFTFAYRSGPHRLDVWRAALLEDGREVASDAHHGHTGTAGVSNLYHLVLPTPAPGAHYQLAAEIGTDPDFVLPTNTELESTGMVSIEGNRTRVFCRLPRNAPVPQGETWTQSFVIGVAPAGQLRRAFLYYLERERAHPYRPYLHYNSWYDTAWDPFALNETNCLEAIRLMGEHLVKARRGTLDGMVFDDGWDDPRTLWKFHSGFPRGFAPLAELCAEYGTRLGVWLSPFGGYGRPRDERLQFGKQQGYEVNAAGLSLAGPKYYAAFKNACVDMIRHYGVNHFKFDGIAAGMSARGAAEYVLDTEAMRRLMLELRAEDPHVFINLTTGSWPSPFWLRFADSVWRQGGDMGFAGVGNRQQQWITYRDQETYRNIVRRGPLYPLNSLMSQGVAYSRRGSAGDPSFHSSGFEEDVRSFFGSGTGLQELYIQPGRLTDKDWDVLAESAQWSRAHADVLVDTHWIGGDPGLLEPYGYASWSSRKGILMLRNPADRPQTFTLDAGSAFELPPGAPVDYVLRSPWAKDRDQAAFSARAGTRVRVALAPFEIRVLEARPE